MKIIKSLSRIVGFTFLALSGFSNAALINTDYMSQGDNKLVYDNVTQLEWLKLDVTKGIHLNTLLNAHAGFRLANAADVDTLFKTLFPTVVVPNNQVYVDLQGQVFENYYTSFGNLFGKTGSDRAYGFYKLGNSNEGVMGTLDLGNQIRFLKDHNLPGWGPHESFGYMLIRDVAAVPSPSVFYFFLVAMGFVICRKRFN